MKYQKVLLYTDLLWKHNFFFLHLLSFLDIEMAQGVEIFLCGRQGYIYHAQSMLRLLKKTWNRETRHQQPWHSWWRHQMETLSALLAPCAGNSPVPVNSPHKGQWRGALMFSLICVWINFWVNNREAGDLRRHHGHYEVNVMWPRSPRIFKS